MLVELNIRKRFVIIIHFSTHIQKEKNIAYDTVTIVLKLQYNMVANMTIG